MKKRIINLLEFAPFLLTIATVVTIPYFFFRGYLSGASLVCCGILWLLASGNLAWSEWCELKVKEKVNKAFFAVFSLDILVTICGIMKVGVMRFTSSMSATESLVYVGALLFQLIMVKGIWIRYSKRCELIEQN